MSTCLRIFCEETCSALRVHPSLQDVTGTVIFIQEILDLWKIINVRTKNKDIRHNNPLESEIKSTDDPRLTKLHKICEWLIKMIKSSCGKRSQSLTKDTATSFHHTINEMVELCRYLIAQSREFVLLGEFSTDPLEKEFSKIRQGSGGTYFITVQQVLEKLNITKIKLLFKLDLDPSNLNVEVGHACNKCGYLFDEKFSEIFDCLQDLEEKFRYKQRDCSRSYRMVCNTL